MDDLEDTAIDEELIERTKGFEGYSSYMYLDSKGYPTVGYGHMISNKKRARDVPFRIGESDSDRYATASEREDAYDRISKRSTDNYDAGYFKPDNNRNQDLSKIYLTKPEATEMLRARLNQANEELMDKFDDFPTYPKKVRQALIDMQMNMGDRKFRTEVYSQDRKLLPNEGWPRFFQAIENRDWTEAGNQSHRKDVPEKRNRITKQLFYDAAKE